MGDEVLRMVAAQTQRLESEIDEMIKRLEPLKSFILPAGSALSTQLHLCRTVARRTERLTVELATMESVNEAAVTYLNRLSDLLFAMARFENQSRQVPEPQWSPSTD